jgi:hypothetical protein
VLVPLDELSPQTLDIWVNAVAARDTTNITYAGGTVPAIYVADLVLSATFIDVADVTATRLSSALTLALNVTTRQLLITRNETNPELLHLDIYGFGADTAESVRVANRLSTLDLSELGATIEVTQRDVYVVLGAQSGVLNSPSTTDAVAKALEAFLSESVVVVFGNDVTPRPKIRPSPPTVYTPVSNPPLLYVGTPHADKRKTRYLLIASATLGGALILVSVTGCITFYILRKKKTRVRSVLKTRARVGVVRKLKL